MIRQSTRLIRLQRWCLRSGALEGNVALGQRMRVVVVHLVRLLLSDQGIGNVCAAMSNRVQHLDGVSHEHRLDDALLKLLNVLPFDLIIKSLVHGCLPLCPQLFWLLVVLIVER